MLLSPPGPEHVLLILTESCNVTDPVAVGKTPLYPSLSLPCPLPSMVWKAVRKRDCIHCQVDSPSPDSGEGLCLVIFCYHYQCSMLCLSICYWTTVFPQPGILTEIIFSLVMLDPKVSWMFVLKIVIYSSKQPPDPELWSMSYFLHMCQYKW